MMVVHRTECSQPGYLSVGETTVSCLNNMLGVASGVSEVSH